MAQKSLTQTTPPTTKKVTETPIPKQEPTPTKEDHTPKPTEPKTYSNPTPQEIPEIIKTFTDGLEGIEGIVYAMRQRLLQLYGPVNYQEQKRIEPPNDIEMKFTEEQANMLNFSMVGNYWSIKPKQYLGAENFAKISGTVRALGGEYISAGRDSHFRVRR